MRLDEKRRKGLFPQTVEKNTHTHTFSAKKHPHTHCLCLGSRTGIIVRIGGESISESKWLRRAMINVGLSPHGSTPQKIDVTQRTPLKPHWGIPQHIPKPKVWKGTPGPFRPSYLSGGGVAYSSGSIPQRVPQKARRDLPHLKLEGGKWMRSLTKRPLTSQKFSGPQVACSPQGHRSGESQSMQVPIFWSFTVTSVGRHFQGGENISVSMVCLRRWRPSKPHWAGRSELPDVQSRPTPVVEPKSFQVHRNPLVKGDEGGETQVRSLRRHKPRANAKRDLR